MTRIELCSLHFFLIIRPDALLQVYRLRWYGFDICHWFRLAIVFSFTISFVHIGRRRLLFLKTCRLTRREFYSFPFGSRHSPTLVISRPKFLSLVARHYRTTTDYLLFVIIFRVIKYNGHSPILKLPNMSTSRPSFPRHFRHEHATAPPIFIFDDIDLVFAYDEFKKYSAKYLADFTGLYASANLYEQYYSAFEIHFDFSRSLPLSA